MSNKEKGQDSKAERNDTYPEWWLRKIDHLKRKLHKNGADKKEEGTQDRMSRRTANATLAIAILTAALIGTSFLQWRVQSGTLDEMQSEQRAWLAPENFKFEEVPAIQSIFPDSQTMIAVIGDTQNVGKEPAFKVLFSKDDESGFRGIIDPNPATFNIPNSDVCKSVIDWVKNQVDSYSGIIYPGQQLPYERYFISSPIQTVDEQHWKVVLSGHGIFFWHDCAVYETINKLHVSEFCFYYIQDIADGKMKTFLCPKGNRAD